MKAVWMALSAITIATAVTWGQSYTVSAKPGAVSYLEGTAELNGDPLNNAALKSTFLAANDVLRTGSSGKAEILLTPGVFLRLGSDSEVRMVSPSLIDTQVELREGDVMVEAAELLKDNHIRVVNAGTITELDKPGLYRFDAGSPPTVRVLDGKATVRLGDRRQELKGGRELVLAENARPQKFDKGQKDDLYAWSNVRSEYQAAATYRLGQSSAFANGFRPGWGSGWYWDNGINSYAWLPSYGYGLLSPFGYGFYGPGVFPYGYGYSPYGYGYGGAPWLYGRQYLRGGHWDGGHHHPVTPAPAPAGQAVMGAPRPVPAGQAAAAGPHPVPTGPRPQVQAPSAPMNSAPRMASPGFSAGPHVAAPSMGAHGGGGGGHSPGGHGH